MTQCFSTRSNTEKRVENMTCCRAFLTNFKVFDFEMKHCFTSQINVSRGDLFYELCSINYCMLKQNNFEEKCTKPIRGARVGALFCLSTMLFVATFSLLSVLRLLILLFVNNNMSPPNRTNRDNHIC